MVILYLQLHSDSGLFAKRDVYWHHGVACNPCRRHEIIITACTATDWLVVQMVPTSPKERVNAQQKRERDPPISIKSCPFLHACEQLIAALTTTRGFFCYRHSWQLQLRTWRDRWISTIIVFYFMLTLSIHFHCAIGFYDLSNPSFANCMFFWQI